jgi:hypothetical protein
LDKIGGYSMKSIEIPMMNFQIGRCVLGWVPVLHGGVPHWKVEQGEDLSHFYIPLSRTPDFRVDFESVEHHILPVLLKKKFEVFVSIQSEKTLCLLVSNKERYDAVASTVPLSIALASLQMVGITIEDLDEKWIELYPAS